MTDLANPAGALRGWAVDLFRAAGCSERQATLSADCPVIAGVAGCDPNGIGRAAPCLQLRLDDDLQMNRRFAVAHDAGSSVSSDHPRGVGPPLLHQAMVNAITARVGQSPGRASALGRST